MPSPEGPCPDDQLLLRARKRNWLLWSILDITLDRNDYDYDMSSPNFAGCVESNFTGLKYSVVTPSIKCDKDSQEIASIQYEPNRLGNKFGPRRLRMILPVVNSSDIDDRGVEDSMCRKYQYSSPKGFRNLPWATTNMIHTLTENSRENLVKMKHIYYGENVEPIWRVPMNAFSLDFRGRVTLPSSKNFIFRFFDELNQPKDLSLQFGKVLSTDEGLNETYTLDFRFPFSPLQAFGIALSVCDR